MYKLSAVNANQLTLSKGRIVSASTTKPTTASGDVMASFCRLLHSKFAPAKQASQTIALTPNKSSRAADQPCVTMLFTTQISSPLATANINKPQKNRSRLHVREHAVCNKNSIPAALAEPQVAFEVGTC